MTAIRLHNNRTRREEELVPLISGKVRLYVCGPTVYDRAHIGNARPVVVFDTLFRLLRHVYGVANVTYVRNFTDVDDKINAKAAETGRPIRDITDETISWYHEDMDALGTLRPTQEPRATEYIAQMIAMIEALIARGHAYTAESHVLFDVRSFPAYGALSGRSVDDMIAGARVEVAPYKRDPMDFVLWKPSGSDLPGWSSPWGRGRPGWHIECSAMSRALLGESFDIHGGGIDLQFPHHENEIAQSCCANPSGKFANIWMHNEMLQVEGKKMSKSLGNFFTVRDLLDQGYPGEVIRFVYMMTHYSRPMDWTAEKAHAARQKLDGYVAQAELHCDFASARILAPHQDIVTALAADLNTHTALTVIDQLAGQPETVTAMAVGLDFIGLLSLDVIEMRVHKRRELISGLRSQASRLAALREEAMKTKDFSSVDAMKSALIEAGVQVQMSKAGVELLPGPGFDADKVRAL